jgi:prepilin-type N-terminal cleavage/methylation domain-containing protein
MQKKTTGFTLIELSIVIVIIGLIVAGVLGGQQLVKEAKLRGVIADVKKYKVASNSFFLQYDHIAGDITNAQDYFGSSVRNGNGDNRIGTVEAIAAWEHLAKAGIIPGEYTGDPESGNYKSLGINVPNSNLSPDAGFNFIYQNTLAANAIEFASNVSCNTGLNGKLLTNQEAYSIDVKIDDGTRSGKVYGLVGTEDGNCSPSGCASGSNYDLDASGKECRLFFKLDKQ